VEASTHRNREAHALGQRDDIVESQLDGAAGPAAAVVLEVPEQRAAVDPDAVVRERVVDRPAASAL